MSLLSLTLAAAMLIVFEKRALSRTPIVLARGGLKRFMSTSDMESHTSGSDVFG